MPERYRNSGYLAVAQSVAWTAGQALDSLTDNEWTDLSDEIDNTTNLYPSADIEIVLASAAFTGTDSTVQVFVIPTMDGTNYPNWTGNVTTDEQENNQYFIGSVVTSGATAAQRMVFRDVLLPQGKYKFGFRSLANVSLAATGNTAKWRPHSGESVTV